MLFITTAVVVFSLLILLIKTSIGFPVPNGTISYLYDLYSYEPICWDIIADPGFEPDFQEYLNQEEK